MARVYIALIYVAVLLRGYQAATVDLDAIDFMHADDKGEKCKNLPQGIHCAYLLQQRVCCGHVIYVTYITRYIYVQCRKALQYMIELLLMLIVMYWAVVQYY